MTEAYPRVNDMLQSEINSFRELERKCDLYYSGLFSQNIVAAAMAEALKQQLAHSGNKAATQRRCFTLYRMAPGRDSLFCRHLPVMLTKTTGCRRHAHWREQVLHRLRQSGGKGAGDQLNALKALTVQTQLRSANCRQQGAGLPLTVATRCLRFSSSDEQPDSQTAMFYLKTKFDSRLQEPIARKPVSPPPPASRKWTFALTPTPGESFPENAAAFMCR